MARGNNKGEHIHGKAGRPKTWLRLIGYVPAVVILPLLVNIFLKNLDDLAARDIRFTLWPLVLSLVLLLVHFVLSGLGWGLMLYFFRRPISLFQAVRISALSLLGRYIPGKVWTILGKVYLAGRLGVSRKTALAASAYEFFLFNLGGLFTFVVIDFIQPSGIEGARTLQVLLLVLSALAVAFPNLITYVLNLGLRLTKRETIGVSLKPFEVLATLFYYSGAWLVTGLSFYFFALALLPGLGYALATKALVIASIAGFLVIIAPGGLGVREGVMTFILSAAGVPVPQAVLAALGARIWSTAGELIVVVPMLFIKGEVPLAEAVQARPGPPKAGPHDAEIV